MDRREHSAVSTGVPLTQAPIPSWIRIRVTESENFKELKQIVKGSRLHTVCEEARCPNIFDCWNRRTATFMILGDVCTRACRFCAVTSGRPTELDLGEPPPSSILASPFVSPNQWPSSVSATLSSPRSTGTT